MKKYIIFAVPRTGSTLYANLLGTYCNHVMQNKDSTTCYSSVSGTPDWSYPIQHTHQLSVMSSAPKDYVKLMPTRSLLDSVISVMIADLTDTWTMISDADEEAYSTQYKNAKINIDLDQFVNTVRASNELYINAFAIFNACTGEKHLLEYNTHAKDYSEFYTKLNIDYQLPEASWSHLPTPRWVNTKMSVDKFTIVENLQQVLDAYKSIKGVYNFNDDVTVAYIENILKERQ